MKVAAAIGEWRGIRCISSFSFAIAAMVVTAYAVSPFVRILTVPVLINLPN